MSWQNVGRLHTVPIDDLHPHSLCADCACGPKLEWEDHVQLIRHNAFDGRDFEEPHGVLRAVEED